MLQVQAYSRDGKIEELYFMAGASLEQLMMLGCPIEEAWLSVREIIGAWADSPTAPPRLKK